jgi:hypothetical protein
VKKRETKIIIDKKRRGEWAETCFLGRVLALGWPISKPWGDTRSFDFVVGWPGTFVAVQVKSTIFELDEGYLCGVCSGKKRYGPGAFDFLAAYVIQEDAWYIIPGKEVFGMESISLNTKTNRANYEKYREAWTLLQPKGIPKRLENDIQACVDPEYEAVWGE